MTDSNPPEATGHPNHIPFHSGTLGQPFPADIERRDRAMAVLELLPQHSVEADFYRSLILHSEREINAKDLIDEGLADRREW